MYTNFDRRVQNFYKEYKDKKWEADGSGCRCLFFNISSKYGIKIYPKIDVDINPIEYYNRQELAWSLDMAPRCWGFKEEHEYYWFFTETAKVYYEIITKWENLIDRDRAYDILDKIGMQISRKYEALSGIDMSFDMHEGNFGILNGKWVIIDFSHESC